VRALLPIVQRLAEDFDYDSHRWLPNLFTACREWFYGDRPIRSIMRGLR
jgi:hypothetical protein